MIKTQFSQSIKVFRIDNAMEYKDNEFLDFLHKHGIICHRSCLGTSQQNGRAERKHKHILEIVRSLLIFASCPERFWGEAALTAVYAINRIPSIVINNKSPYKRLYGISPNYHQLKVFGCDCFILLQPNERTELEPCACLCCFLRYDIKHKGYQYWSPISKRLRISGHVFWKHKCFHLCYLFIISLNHPLTSLQIQLSICFLIIVLQDYLLNSK